MVKGTSQIFAAGPPVVDQFIEERQGSGISALEAKHIALQSQQAALQMDQPFRQIFLTHSSDEARRVFNGLTVNSPLHQRWYHAALRCIRPARLLLEFFRDLGNLRLSELALFCKKPA